MNKKQRIMNLVSANRLLHRQIGELRARVAHMERDKARSAVGDFRKAYPDMAWQGSSPPPAKDVTYHAGPDGSRLVGPERRYGGERRQLSKRRQRVTRSTDRRDMMGDSVDRCGGRRRNTYGGRRKFIGQRRQA